MRFLFRSLLVLAAAVAVGLVLYYAVQALPGDSPRPASPAVQRPSENPPPRAERPERNRGGGIRWRLILDVSRRVITFSLMVLIAVLGKNFIFERRPKKEDPTN